jgi:predicted transcriptional regulator
MPTITVKLDKKQAAKLTRLARVDRVTKSEIVRHLIEAESKIRTGDDLIEWVEASIGKGLGLAQK